MPKEFLKDPDAELDYKFDWSSWLASGESISTYVLTVPTGLTEATASSDSDSVTVWLSGGTAGETYGPTCSIVTDSSPSRTDDRTVHIHVKQR